jgi:hypothetical protein
LKWILYGYESWCPKLREERRFRVFGNRVLRKIFGSKREKTTGGWRKFNTRNLIYTLDHVLLGCQGR